MWGRLFSETNRITFSQALEHGIHLPDVSGDCYVLPKVDCFPNVMLSIHIETVNLRKPAWLGILGPSQKTAGGIRLRVYLQVVL